MFNRKIIAVQTDWGGEYQKLHYFFVKCGISHHVSYPHAHQRNGSAERKHRHIVEVDLSLLAYASMPLKFWDEAFLVVAYLINRTPSKVTQFTTPLERLAKNLIIRPCVCLVVPVGRISVPTISTNFNSSPNNVCFWGLVIFIRDSNALRSPLAECISHVMSCLMKQFFPSPNSTLMPALAFVQRFPFSLKKFAKSEH
jgi:hypothetical protein